MNNTKSHNLKKLNGIAYLSGSDTWIDFPRIFDLLLLQPDKIHLNENNHKDWKYIIPLLTEIEIKFLMIQNKMNVLFQDININKKFNNEKKNDFSNNEKYENKKLNQNIKHFEFDIIDDNEIYLNKHAMDILIEISDCIDLLVLRVQHVKILYQSRDKVFCCLF